uniref:Uncharacterized protein n=1 Tax=viral metagenome TaxID=1070528 RepID=A0A6H1ZTU6_9ZZZZ
MWKIMLKSKAFSQAMEIERLKKALRKKDDNIEELEARIARMVAMQEK